jgi:2,3-bisphosphoglycerate-independent phosphoglycerate mutase
LVLPGAKFTSVWILQQEGRFPEGCDMKYAFLVGDGMGDYPLPELRGKTPLEAAKTPNMDCIASCRLGRLQTVPEGMEPGSDVANLSLLGYDPRKYHTGRSPFEAASMGVNLAPGDVAFRMNLVTLDIQSEDHVLMVSHSAGDISTEEGAALVQAIASSIDTPGVRVFSGIAYRHLLTWRDGPLNAHTLPPHNYLEQDIASYLLVDGSNPIPDLIRRSWNLLKDHPVNQQRRKQGLKEANSIWLWGQGTAPELPLFKDLYGLSGGVISAVDLIKGIGAYAGLKSIPIEGATGYLDTNYIGKGQGAVEALKKLDFIFVHVEAPDEASHNGRIDEKIRAIESFDRDVVGTVLEGLSGTADFKVMVATDHYTPISKRTHSTEPPPFAWAQGSELKKTACGRGFNEKSAAGSDLFFNVGCDMMKAFISE